MSIQPLPDDVVAQIKSSTAITTLNGAVCGLVRNSLDAGASKVNISIDYVRGNCCVEDDGLGIPPAEFHPRGGLGKLHFTSKYPTRKDIHGKYGIFLASLASLSLLSVMSHHHQYYTHNSIQIHNSEVLARHIPSPPDQRLLNFTHGTRVTVRDLFGSMPVRVKQRGIDAERGLHNKHWESLKREIVALLLAWNPSVSVSARELAGRRSFSIHNNQTRDGESSLDLRAKVSKILYRAQLSDEIELDTWIPLQASAGKLSIAGTVSLYPTATKHVQFISIGIHPVSNEHGSNVLYEEINRVFSNSSYGVEEATKNLTSDEYKIKAQEGRNTKDGFSNQDLKGRKGVDRWPMFYIAINIDGSQKPVALQDVDELLDERHGNLAAIVDILKVVAYEFLKKHRFRPKQIKSAKHNIPGKTSRANSSTRSPSRNLMSRPSSAAGARKNELVGDLATTQLSIRCERSSRLRPESPFDLWSRVKSGSLQQSLGDQKVHGQLIDRAHVASSTSEVMTADLGESSSDPATSLFGPDGSLLRAPFDTTELEVRCRAQGYQSSGTENKSSDENIEWTNPVTKETLVIDPTTGFVIQPQTKSAQEERDQTDPTFRKRPRPDGTSDSDRNRSMWLGELLSSWENPIFKTTEPRIPSAIDEANNPRKSLESFGCCTWIQGSPGVGPPVQSRVSKAALRDAEIVAQVDRKFILAKVAVNAGANESTILHSTESLLIIIDQHAADERCRVESLMSNYFLPIHEHDVVVPGAASMPRRSTACTELLERPIKFDISVRDAIQLESMVSHFTHWGIHYYVMLAPPTGNTNQRQLEVTRLPLSIAERCRLEPRLLIELLRKEAWKLDSPAHHSMATRNSSSQENEAETLNWITQLHGCPQGVLDMINSRACRSSIMFNDALSLEECTDLVRRLADCAFPFQCAHGRPSMVPLVDIGNDAAYTHETTSSNCFGKAFKGWKEKG
ncbi:hypothetical protein F5B22DRAFT_600961 [Xylaria bambusicola]|uniref:uncharacterized protein n=1 Tax=Xylaria bambusicola TaxID=326684 RepID=UPI0020077729|nr:uncharacterized protein F5B22DRAFT_600961 [Xylaria bambusicola]KAI0518373.1 hypothetical protein F5B22DRAFT_600961 [Xylaria bambusicola]